MQHAPTVRNAVRSPCSRHAMFRSWCALHTSAAPDVTSITLSSPNPNQRDGASNQPSNRRPRLTYSSRFVARVAATSPICGTKVAQAGRRSAEWGYTRQGGTAHYLQTYPIANTTRTLEARHGVTTCSLRCAAKRPRQFHIHLIPHPNFIPKSTARHHPLRANSCGHHAISVSPWRPRPRPPQVSSTGRPFPPLLPLP